MDHGGPVPLSVRSEEDRRAEDALERSDQSPVLGTALLDTECIEHFGGAVESDPRGLLSNCHRRQKDRNQPILSPRESIARVTGDLKHESSVPPFVKETSGWRALHREPTEYKRPRREPQILRFAFPLLPDHLNRVCLSEFPFGDDQLRVLQPQQITGALQTRIAGVVRRVLCSVMQSVDPRVSSRLATQRPNCGRTVPKLDLLTLLGLAFERKADSLSCWKQ